MSNIQKDTWVNSLLEKLTLEQKVGQLMVLGAAGPVVTPHVKELIEKYHVGGFRIAQKFHGGSSESRVADDSGLDYNLVSNNTYDRPSNLNTKRITCTPKEYAEYLNILRDYALNRKDGIGLHFTYDQEGEGADFLFNQRLFPYPMGMVASGDKELAYKIGLAAGKQARALGANMIHSPVLDVNTNPNNPEIGTRAYSDKADIVTEYALESLRGYSEAGIICTGKHFPGRGESEQDAHFGLPVVDLSKERMLEEHIKPYKEMIAAGLPAIMAAFTAYTGFEGGEIPAATNPHIMTDFLRGELGFEGVITTDNVQMKGLLGKYELSEAVIRCLLAGCDLVLFRSESPAAIYVIEKVLEAVRSDRYSEKQLDQSVRRILAMRYDMGLHINGGKVDINQADSTFENPFVMSIAKEAAEKTTLLLKNKEQIIPLSKDKKVLLIEQIHHFHSFINNMYSHPGMLWEEMRKLSDNVELVLINETYTETDKKAVLGRLKGEYDVVVTTSYYNYRSHGSMIELLKDINKCGKPVIVAANTPYENFAVPAEVETAIVSFCASGRENITSLAEVIYGELVPTAKLDVKLGK